MPQVWNIIGKNCDSMKLIDCGITMLSLNVILPKQPMNCMKNVTALNMKIAPADWIYGELAAVYGKLKVW